MSKPSNETRREAGKDRRINTLFHASSALRRRFAGLDGRRLQRFQEIWFSQPRTVRRIVVGVLGGTVLLIGVALVVLPGPAVVVLPLGLGILATEFVWARRLLRKGITFLRRKAKSGKGGPPDLPPLPKDG